MNVEVSVAGHNAEWTFSSALALRRWTQARPWEHNGGVLALALSGPEGRRLLTPALRAQVLGLSAEQSGSVEWTAVEHEPTRPLAASLLMGCGFPQVPASRADILRALVNTLGSNPRLFAIQCQAYCPDAWNEAQSLLDQLRKASPPLPLCLLFLDLPNAGSCCLDPLDFTQGTPAHPGQMLPSSSVQQWPAYLHHRLAWEAGGCIDTATRWTMQTEFVRPLIQRRNDDEALELALNSLAQLESEANSINWPALAAWVNVQCQTRSVRGADPAPVALRAWLRQLHGAWELRAPWMARYLLRRYIATSDPARAWLRSQLVCRPLVESLLATCLTLEHLLRARLASWLGDIPPSTVMPPEKVLELERTICSSTPSGHPAAPDKGTGLDVWSHASLGALVSAIHQTPRAPSSYLADIDILRKTRNSLAHGGYVCWLDYQTLGNLAAKAAGW